MKNNSHPDLHDIDAFLRTGTSVNKDNPETPTPTPAAKHSGLTTNRPSHESPLGRLLARATHACGNIRAAVNYARDKQKIFDIDRELTDLLARDLDYWEDTLATLEQAFQPTAGPSGTQVNRVLIASDAQGNLKFPLNRDVITIGRKSDNDIHIHSRYISRYHARVVSDATGSVIEDLGSANGLLVNTQQTRRHLLKSGDLITLGQTQLKFIDLAENDSDEGCA